MAIQKGENTMVFLCFAVKDRVPLINDFYHYLSNFGIDIWYDRRNIFLGDNRIDANIINGASNKNIKYAIIFYSSNFENGNICLEEYKILTKRYAEKDIFLFPVFIDNVPQKINSSFSLLKKLVFKKITNQADFPALCLHIIAKITADEVVNLKYNNINDIISGFENKNCLYFKLLLEYQDISKENYNMRIAFLFAIYKYILSLKEDNYFHSKTMNFIYHKSCLNIIIDERRELQIMENIIIYEGAYL